MVQASDGMADSRFDRLRSYLEQDPGNPALIADAIEAGLAEKRVDDAEALLISHPLDAPRTAYLAGLVAMHRHDWPRAASHYQSLMGAGDASPAIRFNLAWSLAMDKQFDAALAALDAATAEALPQAAELEIRMRHQIGEFDEAGARARDLLSLHPEHRGLNAAVATLAIDIEDTALAAQCARVAGDHPEALTTLGTLALETEDSATARLLFSQALQRDPTSPRALIGQGLSRLLESDSAGAALDLDRGAQGFETHLGSWIAAGWAHFIGGDTVTARARFEHALAIDDSFAEIHGSLAALDILDGNIEEARRRIAIARRLDRASFSAALAEMLLASGSGDTDKAKRIFEIALATPLDASGRTLGQSFARLAARGG